MGDLGHGVPAVQRLDVPYVEFSPILRVRTHVVRAPTGGTPAKPVGMVCFAWASKDGSVRSETLRFTGDREKVRRQSVMRALQGVLEWLDGRAPRA